jgi:Motility quorum-sensing regulator, toxin of MqsA
MPRWLPKILVRIRELAVARKVLLTLKARRELASLDIGLDEEDACDILASLEAQDSAGRLESVVTGEWMYLFKPQLADTVCYLKVILRDDCVLISFHEDQGDDHDEEDDDDT